MAGAKEPFNTEKLAEDLVFVKKEGNKETSYGGWKRDLFVKKIDSPTEEKLLICTLCKGVLRDPYAVTVSQNKEPRCSVCLPKKKALITIADLIRSAIIELDMYCPLRDSGCQWNGTTEEVLCHLKDCGFFIIPCPLGCREKIGLSEQVEILNIHISKLYFHLNNACSMRLILCNYCHSELIAFQMNSHLLNCEEFPVECPNRCSQSINVDESFHTEIYKIGRENIPFHLNTVCPLQEISCPYAKYGCKVELLRKDLEEHKQDKDCMQQHFDLLEAKLGEVLAMDAERTALSHPISSSQAAQPTHSSKYHALGGIEWKLFDYKKNLTKKNECLSPPFYSSGYKFRFILYLERDFLHIYFEVLKGCYDSELTWPLNCETIAVLVNKAGNKDMMEVFRSDEFQNKEAFNKPIRYTPNIQFGGRFIPMNEIKFEKFSLDGFLLVRVFIRCF